MLNISMSVLLPSRQGKEKGKQRKPANHFAANDQAVLMRSVFYSFCFRKLFYYLLGYQSILCECKRNKGIV